MKVKVTLHLPREDLKRLLRLCDELYVVSPSRLAEIAVKTFMTSSGVKPTTTKLLDGKLVVKLDFEELEDFKEECKKRGYSDVSLCFTDAIEQWLNVQLSKGVLQTV